MGKLTDILCNGDAARLYQVWDQTEAARELTALPPGRYTAYVIAGVLEKSKTNSTPGYKLTFAISDGEFAGRQFWHDIWLTPAAMPMAKRDLAKLGVTSLDQLERPLPRGIRCECQLVLRTGEDGAPYNRVRTFTVVGIDPPERDAFAPKDQPDAGPGDAAELSVVGCQLSAGGVGEVNDVPF